MPLGDVTEQQNHVSSYYGADSSVVPASFDAAIFTGNPYDDGVEVDFPGYARVTLTNDTTVFVAGTDGSVTAILSLADSTGAAGTGSSVVTDDGRTWVLYNGTAIDSWDWLATPLSIDDAAAIEDIEITPYIPNGTSVA